MSDENLLPDRSHDFQLFSIVDRDISAQLIATGDDDTPATSLSCFEIDAKSYWR